MTTARAARQWSPHPNHGKSEFLDALLVGLEAAKAGARHSAASRTSRPSTDQARYLGRHPCPTRRMTRADAKAALTLNNIFFIPRR
jgi:hypothetical protein